MLKRRELYWAVAGMASALPEAQAQTPWVEGKDYVRLAQPVPVAASGKIELLSFFWYGCPHCYAMEPSLDAWVRQLPADVLWRRVPVGFSPQHELHQRAFYALESLNLLEAVHRKLLAAIHAQHRSLAKEAELADFIASLGLDRAAFTQALTSSAVAAQARAAKQLSAAYRIDGVPALGIHGRYYTSPALAGNPARALAVAGWLIQQVRKPGTVSST